MLQEVTDVKHLLNPIAYKIHNAVLSPPLLILWLQKLAPERMRCVHVNPVSGNPVVAKSHRPWVKVRQWFSPFGYLCNKD